MSVCRAAALSAIVLVAPLIGRAADAPAKLPDDGWWVRYFVTMRGNQPNDESTIKRTYALVGTAIENNQKCRWVEMKSVPVVDGKDLPGVVVKFLVPERELLNSGKPLESLVRCWKKDADGAVEAQKFNQPRGAGGFAGSADFWFGGDLLFLPGVQRNSKAVNEKNTVEYEHGRLEIAEARAFKYQASRPAPVDDRKQEFVFECTVWNHPAVAPGFAALRERVEYRISDTLVQAGSEEYVLQDFGTDAKSAMPEHN
jgi:hypothetical protein